MGLVIHYAESSDSYGLLPQLQLSFPGMYGSVPVLQRYRKEDNAVSNPWRKRHFHKLSFGYLDELQNCRLILMISYFVTQERENTCPHSNRITAF